MAQGSILDLLLPLLEDEEARLLLEQELSKSIDGVTRPELPRVDPFETENDAIKNAHQALRERNQPKPEVPLTNKQRFKDFAGGEQGAALAANFATSTDFNDTGSIATGIGSAAGTAIGFGLGGPVGAAAGGLIGGGLGGLLGDDDDEAEKLREERLFRQNLMSFNSFLSGSNQQLFQQALGGRSFF